MLLRPRQLCSHPDHGGREHWRQGLLRQYAVSDLRRSRDGAGVGRGGLSTVSSHSVPQPCVRLLYIEYWHFSHPRVVTRTEYDCSTEAFCRNGIMIQLLRTTYFLRRQSCIGYNNSRVKWILINVLVQHIVKQAENRRLAFQVSPDRAIRVYEIHA